MASDQKIRTSPVRRRFYDFRAGCGTDFSEDNTTFLGDTEVYRKERFWNTTPGYKSKVLYHQKLLSLPFSGTIREIYGDRLLRSESSSAFWSTDNGQPCFQTRKFGREVSMHLFMPCSDVAAISGTEALVYKVLQRARSNQVNLPVFIAELGKTSQMVVARATHLVFLIRALKAGRFGDFYDGLRLEKRLTKSQIAARVTYHRRNYGKNPLDTAANIWLESRYGWLPFMMEVQSAVMTCLDLSERDVSKMGYAKAKQSVERDTEDPNYVFEVNPGHTGILTENVREDRRLIWRFEILPESVPARFGLTNPLDVAWELLPLSFVADWFLPIGDYIKSLDTNLRFRFADGSFGLKRTIFRTAVINKSSYYDSASGIASSKYVRWERSPLSQNPAPSLLEFRLGVPGGWKQPVSAIALLHTELKGLRNKNLRI